MTDNRTTELRRLLTERGIEYETNDHMGVCETSWNGFTVMQLTPSAKLIMTVTPEQAIAATLGSEREKDLESLVKQLWYLVNHRSGYGYAAALESIEELGIEVDDSDFCSRGARREP